MLAVFHNGVHVGDGLMLLAAFSYALYGVLLRTGRCRCRPGNRLSCNRSSRCSTCRCFSKVPAAQAALDMKTVPLILCRHLLVGAAVPCGSRACTGWGPTVADFINLLPLFTAMAAFALLREQLPLLLAAR